MHSLLTALLDALGKVQLCAYLVNMGVRLIEMHRILKPAGSLYLHCDDSAGHYLKVVLDAVFGPAQFRNDIAWRRATAHNDPSRFGRILDTILFYGKTSKMYWAGHEIATPKTEDQLRSAYPAEDERGRFRASDLTGPLHGMQKGSPSTLPWRKYDVYAAGRCWSAPLTGQYAKYIDDNYIAGYLQIETIQDRLEALDAAGLIHHPHRGKWPGLKRYAAADQGIVPQNLILEPMGFTNYSTGQIEYLGYPTQKPVALLDKLIRASCPPGGLVLDPFCGCGTTVAAAEILRRKWIGIDITYAAIAAIKERFRRRDELHLWGKIEILGEPQTPAEVDQRLLAEGSEALARKEFEKFCVTTVGGLPNNKMGADGGIDGRIPLEGGLTAICSVKSGQVSVSAVRELKGLLKAKQVAGVLITRHAPTAPMRNFARQAGVVQPAQIGLYQADPYPQIQILTLEEILKGQLPQLPFAR